MTEREKQLAGLPYDGANAELVGMQLNAKLMTKRLNDKPDMDAEEQKSILEELLGKAGKYLRVIPPIRVDFGCNIFTGDNVFINQNCTFLDTNTITIGERVMFAPDVKVYAADHPVEGHERYRDDGSGKAYITTTAKPVRIGDDVWIGGRAIILPGVTIGNNVVIGAGSVVTKDIPDNCVAVGNPCKVVKKLQGKNSL